jgi:hypothetical protein
VLCETIETRFIDEVDSQKTFPDGPEASPLCCQKPAKPNKSRDVAQPEEGENPPTTRSTGALKRAPYIRAACRQSRVSTTCARCPDEELAVQALLRQLDFHAQELRIIDASLARPGSSARRSSG